MGLEIDATVPCVFPFAGRVRDEAKLFNQRFVVLRTLDRLPLFPPLNRCLPVVTIGHFCLAVFRSSTHLVFHRHEEG
jgi:hypothetical protein